MLASVGSRVPSELFGSWLRGATVVFADDDVGPTLGSRVWPEWS